MSAPGAAFSADDTLLSRHEIKKRFPHIPTSANHLRKLVAQGKFPAPIPISSRRRVWRLSAIEAYIRRKERGFQSTGRAGAGVMMCPQPIFREDYYYLFVDKSDETEFAFAEAPEGKRSYLVKLIGDWEYCRTRTHFQYIGPAMTYIPVRPLGQDWELYDKESSDLFAVWRRRRL